MQFRKENMTAALPIMNIQVPQINPIYGNTIQLITEAYRRRRFHMNMRIKLWNSLYSQLRRGAGYNIGTDNEKCKKLAQEAMTILNHATDDSNMEESIKNYNHGRKRALSEEAVNLALNWCDDALRTKQALKSMEPAEKAYEKAMIKHAEELPKHVLEWIESERCHGFGLLSLASIVAEVGDLAAYSTPAKLWKRLGLAVIEGCAQGHPKGFWRDENGEQHGHKPTAEEWIEHGYCKKRRSLMWNVGVSLIRASGYYKKNIYDTYKAYDRKRHPAPTQEEIKANMTMKKLTSYTDIHMHRRAQRYMEKKFLCDLWNVWCFNVISIGWVTEASEIKTIE